MVTTKRVFEFAIGFGTMGLIAVFILFLTYILSGMDAFIKKQNVPTIGQYDNIIICLDSVISFYILLLPILLKVSNHISTSGPLPINENQNNQQKYQSDVLNYYISNYYIISYQYSLQEQCQLILLSFGNFVNLVRILLHAFQNDYFPNKI